VLLAACLAQEAEVLLLDEPSTFLDIDQQLQCFSMLREEAERGRLCVAVTHDLNLALSFCTRLVVLAEGVVARDVSIAEATRESEWLGLFSRRLSMGATPEGTPWVWYR
jgi:ABC-type cobalamin/Fe3+-siderophores transport system ATPase subunit